MNEDEKLDVQRQVREVLEREIGGSELDWCLNCEDILEDVLEGIRMRRQELEDME